MQLYITGHTNLFVFTNYTALFTNEVTVSVLCSQHYETKLYIPDGIGK